MAGGRDPGRPLQVNGAGKGVLILIGTPAALMGMIVFLVLFGFGSDDASACTTQGAASSSTGPRTPVDGYAGDQLDNAAAIMDAAAGLGLSRQAQVLGVMAAMGESSLRAIDYGDGAVNPDGSIADSIGLFQQQSSWGSVQERMDPTSSAKLFLQRLQAVKGWSRSSRPSRSTRCRSTRIRTTTGASSSRPRTWSRSCRGRRRRLRWRPPGPGRPIPRPRPRLPRPPAAARPAAPCCR
ncbi:hypothetical protein [Clavibacter zhangzhiyongii]|uniref:hypothetical protein n=1 Tax=Clavibacter zhangzhiyongii TaxID=2768071 RepID=UPI0039DFD637